MNSKTIGYGTRLHRRKAKAYRAWANRAERRGARVVAASVRAMAAVYAHVVATLREAVR